MSITVSLGATNYIIPETDETDWGEQVTNFLVRTATMLDGVSALKSTIPVPLMKSTTSALAAGATLTPTHPTHRVSGSGSAVTLSASTSIANGTYNGELLRLEGDHATNTVTIQDASNVQLRGDITLGLNDTLDLVWDSTLGDWKETARKQSHRLMNQKGLELFEATANGSNKITLRAPAALGGDITWTLPNADSVGFFRSDGAGGITIVAGTSSLDDAYNNGSTITVDTAAITLTVTAAINGITVNKTNTSTGQCVDIDNDGAGAGLRINQDGANYGLEVNRPTGGHVARFRSPTSGNPYISLEASGSVEGRWTAVASGAIQIGSASSSALELHTNGTARVNIAAAANEVAIGGATESGVALKVHGAALIINNNFLQGETAAGANRSLIGVNASDQVVVGDASSSEIVFNFSTADQVKLSNKTLALIGDNGSETREQWGFNDVTVSSGTTVDTASFFPAGSVVTGMSFRITTSLGAGPTSISCGTTGDPTRYLNAVSPLTSGTTFNSLVSGSATQEHLYAAATTMRLTANGGSFSGGVIRCVVHYKTLVAPTS